MKSSLSMLPREFQNRQLFKLVAQLADKVLSEELTETLSITRTEYTNDVIQREYVTQVNKVYTDDIEYTDTDYYIQNNAIYWVSNKPDVDSEYYIDVTYYDTCELESDFAIKDPLLESIITEYKDLSAVMAYFIMMVKTSLGTKYAVSNLISLLQYEANIIEWYTTSDLKAFKFKVKFDTVPSNAQLLKIYDFIDFIFQIKNERTHLARVGMDLCGDAMVWDYFKWDYNIWSDSGGISYKDVKICFVEEHEFTLNYELPIAVKSQHTSYEAEHFLTSKTQAYWSGYWIDEPFDTTLLVEGEYNSKLDYLINGNMELDSNWTGWVDDAGLIPTDTLEPSDSLTPGVVQGIVVDHHRNSIVEFVREGLYSRYVEVANHAGIISDSFNVIAGTKYIDFFIYTSDFTEMEVLITDQFGTVLETHTVSGIVVDIWNYKRLDFSLTGDYKLVFKNSIIDATNKIFYIDDVTVTM